MSRSGTAGGLLARGMLAGLVAGLVAALFSAYVGEPSIERAIAFEAAIEQASVAAHEPELVSRSVQGREGLLAAGAIYGAAIGGLFGLGFAFALGRVGALDPRGTAAALAAAGFVAIALVPTLKYPANPPAVGVAETIGARTLIYFVFVLASLAAMFLAAAAREPLCRRFGTRTGSFACIALFVALVGAAAFILPAVDEVPSEFPSDLLFTFRCASLATQAVLWSMLGFGFVLLLPAFSARRPAR